MKRYFIYTLLIVGFAYSAHAEGSNGAILLRGCGVSLHNGQLAIGTMGGKCSDINLFNLGDNKSQIVVDDCKITFNSSGLASILSLRPHACDGLINLEPHL